MPAKWAKLANKKTFLFDFNGGSRPTTDSTMRGFLKCEAEGRLSNSEVIKNKGGRALAVVALGWPYVQTPVRSTHDFNRYCR
jgi:hypothetical protein